MVKNVKFHNIQYLTQCYRQIFFYLFFCFLSVVFHSIGRYNKKNIINTRRCITVTLFIHITIMGLFMGLQNTIYTCGWCYIINIMGGQQNKLYHMLPLENYLMPPATTYMYVFVQCSGTYQSAVMYTINEYNQTISKTVRFSKGVRTFNILINI